MAFFMPLAGFTARDEFGQVDPYGFGMAIIAISVVFLALILLYVLFSFISRAFQADYKKKRLTRAGKHEEAADVQPDIPGDVVAAISLALHFYVVAQHDHENTVITLKKVSKVYSPWSSKIYGLRKYPS